MFSPVSQVALNVTKIHISKFNKRGGVVMLCHFHLAREAEVLIVIVLTERLKHPRSITLPC